MRRRITRVAAAAVVLAVLVLGAPLAFAVSSVTLQGEHGELEQAALRAASQVSAGFRGGDPIELPRAAADIRVGIYTPAGDRVAGVGPTSAAIRDQVRRGASFSGKEAGELVDTIPVTQGERVIAVARASSDTSGVRTRTLWWWGALFAAGVAAAGVAIAFAARQSRRLAQPIVDLASSAGRFAEGSFGMDPRLTGVVEIDQLTESMRSMGVRLGELIARERAFTARASHQLRTPLTQLRLELERGLDTGRTSEAATAALSITDQLSATIDDVLRTARPTPPRAARLRLDVLLEQVQAEWHGTLAAQDRPLRLLIEDHIDAAASAAVARQVLHVLIDNALHHGSGTVTLRLRESHGAAAIDVEDEGSSRLDPRHHRTGMGLPMATSLAEGEGGRLVQKTGETTTFTLILPRAAG